MGANDVHKESIFPRFILGINSYSFCFNVKLQFHPNGPSTYKTYCNLDRAQQFSKEGHTYLHSDGDSEACETLR